MNHEVYILSTAAENSQMNLRNSNESNEALGAGSRRRSSLKERKETPDAASF